MRVLLLTPPMVQCNTPYPATPLLTAFLRQHGVDAVQADLALELALKLFSRAGLTQVAATVRQRFAGRRRVPPSVAAFLARPRRYIAVIAEVVAFLQGRSPDTAGRILTRRWLPEGPRFAVLAALAAAQAMGLPRARAERAQYLASLFIDDLADVVKLGVDRRFALSRYAERLGLSAPSFAPLAASRRRRPTLVDRWLDELTTAVWRRWRPAVVGLTVPFPGNVYAAFRIARRLKRLDPTLKTVLGGGYVNTELRGLADPAVFDDFDYLCYDDGEVPLLRLVEHLAGRRPARELLRTRVRRGRRVVWLAGTETPRLRHRDRPAPCYDGLPLARYFGMSETPNPMTRLWTQRRWNKLTLAHGCYWHRCRFCDTALDYIRRYDPADAATVMRWLDAVVAQTGERGFHFVDEAAPPALLFQVAARLRATGRRLEWWTNIRFERQFTPARARLLARAGCLAVTGGLECASPRLLALMHKGVTLEQTARVTRAFADAGILVHLYLMYGFPTQTVPDTVDALEFVRQLFAAGWVQSAYWHRFVLTVHSAIHADPAPYAIRVRRPGPARFARNAVPYHDPAGVDHDALGQVLHRATYNFMLGVLTAADVRSWFPDPAAVPPPTLPPDFVRRAGTPRRTKSG